MLDANALVNEIVPPALKGVLHHASGRKIAGVAVSTFWHSFVGVDENGVIRENTRSFCGTTTAQKAQADALRRELDAETYTQRTGCQIHTSYLPARLRWLAETDRADV